MATFKARVKAGSKELTVSLYQAIVLLLFNDVAEMEYCQILEADIHETDVFYFNADFTDPCAKMHTNSIQGKETPEESKRTQTRIDSARKYYLDAAILKTQTIEAVKSHFVPEVRVIEQRITGLVEQEYLRRDKDDMNNVAWGLVDE
ncbi:hypothetical protein SCLCIDRAFT_33997 [Scleroderma citrinum Foug A]|uniref:Cullin neddylation domain-containing protein n=1 Tax=Scleroderma citrinum Foug A TaxID=1036808 RepID=A0A0C2ZCP6_9AGAM|nr:hypothetical protein SCLCIDRAFT_33997 [Scleroderma citrinum Foug A]